MLFPRSFAISIAGLEMNRMGGIITEIFLDSSKGHELKVGSEIINLKARVSSLSSDVIILC